MSAACAGVTEPLWDATVDGENELERVRRQAAGLRFCGRCTERDACLAAVDLRHDDGLRGGAVLPTIHDSDRRSWTTWQAGYSGLGELRNAATSLGGTSPTCENGPTKEKTARGSAAPTADHIPGPDRPHLSERGSAVSIMLPSESDRNNQARRVAHMGGAA